MIKINLFPPPSALPSQNNPLIPRTWPGVTPSSTTALQSILTDNYERWHVFFNDRHFHNHTTHTVLSLWRLGADASILESAYKLKAGSAYLKPAFPSPNSINQQNWQEYLGDDRYYQAYVKFFEAQVNVKSFGAILEEYIFSPHANFVKDAGKQPQMLTRLFANLLHPMIHVGLGVEFNLPGTVAEGLAQTAIDAAGPDSGRIIPLSWFVQDDAGLVSKYAQGVNLENPKTGTHAFTVLARILADSRFEEKSMIYGDILHDHGDAIREYVDKWDLTGDLQKKVEELLWTVVLMYGVGGLGKNGDFNADFFTMHFVTSSLLLAPIFALLKCSSQELLLRGYFSTCMVWYIARGRPELDIARFFGNEHTLHPVPPGAKPIPHTKVFPSPTSRHAVTPDPWLPIIQTTLTHPDEHLPKFQRALAEYSSHFGSTPAGYFSGTELKGAELIDGTLFVRTAGLTADRLGWVREGEAPLQSPWDNRGFCKVAEKI